MSLTACGFSMFNQLKLKIMIYFKNFKNAKEFNELFGIVEHGNGAKSRRNKILLEVLKNKEFHKWWKLHGHAYRDFGIDLRTVKSMSELKKLALVIMRYASGYEIMLKEILRRRIGWLPLTVALTLSLNLLPEHSGSNA